MPIGMNQIAPAFFRYLFISCASRVRSGSSRGSYYTMLTESFDGRQSGSE
jgi:hypothetical protein